MSLSVVVVLLVIIAAFSVLGAAVFRFALKNEDNRGRVGPNDNSQSAARGRLMKPPSRSAGGVAANGCSRPTQRERWRFSIKQRSKARQRSDSPVLVRRLSLAGMA